MLKFIKGHMASIDGVSIFPIISFIIFFSIFIFVLFWVFKMKKSEVSELAHIPLESNNDINNDNL
jgi:cell division septal protein FtsQ